MGMSKGGDQQVQAGDAASGPRPLVVVVCGQTASGKSALCARLASRMGGEVVSMDALKVYRGMDIGTAKDRGSVGAPIHLTDMVWPHEEFNVAMYLRALEGVLADVVGRGRVPVIDCGTPLYLRAFLSGMVEGPEPDAELRAALEARASGDLHAELVERDAAAAGRLHPNDRKRVIRALEYAIQTGEALSPRQTQWQTRRSDYRVFMTGPLWPGEALHRRIGARVDAMMAAGLLEEVRGIANAGGFSRTAREAIGYRQMLEHLAGLLTLSEAVELTKLRTRQLARAQMKWFRRYGDVKWLIMDGAASNEEAERQLGLAAMFLAQELAPLAVQRGHS